MVLTCTCGKVAFAVQGAPIAVVSCYCDDCQSGSEQIDHLSGSARLRDADGGTPYALFRKDRVKCTRGPELLRDLRLKERSPTRRVYADCCNAGLYLDFQKGHWLTVYRARLEPAAPPVQLRIQTRFKPAGSVVPDDVPAYPGLPPRLFAKVMLARLAMLFSAGGR